MSVLILLIVFYGSVQWLWYSGWLKDFIKSEVQSTWEKELGYQLEIKHVSGSIWKEIQFDSLSWGKNSSIDKINLRYQWNEVLFKNRLIQSISLKRPEIDFSDINTISDQNDRSQQDYSLQIKKLIINEGSLIVHPDNTLENYVKLDSIQSSLELIVNNEEFNIDLKQFEAQLISSFQKKPIKLSLDASISDQLFNIKNFLIETTAGSITTNGNIKANNKLIELTSLSDSIQVNRLGITSLESLEFPFSLDLSFSGRLDSIHIVNTFNSKVGGTIRTELDLKYRNEWLIDWIDFEINNLENISFPYIEDMISIEKLKLSLFGKAPLSNLKNSKLAFLGSAENISCSTFQLSAFDLHGSVRDDSVRLNLKSRLVKQTIDSRWLFTSIWDSLESKHQTQVENLNLKRILKKFPTNTSLNGRVESNFKHYPNGIVEFGEVKSKFRESSIHSFVFDSLKSKGTLESFTTLEHIDIYLPSSNPSIDLFVDWSKDISDFTITLSDTALNIGDFFPTSISSAIHVDIIASGKGKNLSDAQFETQIDLLPSSLLGKELFQSGGLFYYDKGSLKTDEFTINSEIINATVEGEGSILNPLSTENRLDFFAEIKSFDAFKNFYSVEQIDGIGEIYSSLQPVNDKIVWDADFRFQGLQLDNASLESLTGSSTVTFEEGIDSIEYQLNILAESPAYQIIQFSDFEFASEGHFVDKTFIGLGNLGIRRNSKRLLFLTSNYKFESDSILRSEGYINEIIFNSPKNSFLLENPVYWSLKPNFVNLQPIKMKSSDADLTFGYFSNENDSRFIFDLNRIDVVEAYNTFLKPIDASVITSGKWIFREQNSISRLNTSFKADSFIYQNVNLGSLDFSSTIQNDHIINSLDWQVDESEYIRIKHSTPIFWHPTLTLNSILTDFKINTTIENVNSNRLKPLYPNVFDSLDTKISGLAEFEVKNGTLLNENMDLNLNEFHYGSIELDSILIKINPLDEALNVDLNSFQNGFNKIQISGNLDAPWNSSISNKKMNLTWNTTPLDLKQFRSFIPNQIFQQLDGGILGNGEISGNFENPDLYGRMILKDGSIEIVNKGIVLRNFHSTITFDEKDIAINQLSALSNTGTLQVTGNLKHNNAAISETNLNIETDRFQLYDTRNVKMNVSSSISINGSSDSLRISGDGNVNNGVIYLENFGSSKIESIDLKEDSSLTSIVNSIYNQASGSIRFKGSKNIYVKNRKNPEVNLELKGDVEIKKEIDEPFKLYGSLKSTDGYAKQFAKKFDVKTSTITFTGDPTNPNIDIDARYNLKNQQGIEIKYLIKGTVKEPKFTFESNPEMSVDDIVSYTLFGKPFAALMGWQQGITKGSTSQGVVSDATVGVLVDRVEEYATDRLGIDVIEIDNSASGTTSGTSIRAGKYLNERTFVALVQQLGGTEQVSQVVLEYLLRENLELILTQSSDERSGLDLRWRWNY